MKLYDEKEAVAYVRSRCGCVGMSDDDILIVIDAIFDYYDENGDLDLDLDFDDDDDDDRGDDAGEITDYVTDVLSDSGLPAEVIATIVKAELDYENSLGL